MQKIKKITEADVNIGTNNGVTNVGADDNKTAGAPANTGIKPPEPNKPAPVKPTGQVGYSTLKGADAKPADDKSPAAVKAANINKNAQVSSTAEPVKEGEETITNTTIQKKIEELIRGNNPEKREELIKMQLVRDSLIPFEKSQYNEFGKYFNNAPDDEMNKMIKAANADKYYFDLTVSNWNY